ncbi:MAG: hypothetical protein GY874_18955 [Desulfobacteraceae bacterium]|nr:hypothetical protein [Desulfobacteraceae bacterium]
MSCQIAHYRDIRKKMHPGDVIAFGGKKNISEIIKWATKSSVSHVGIILQSILFINNEQQDGILNQIIESTSLNNFSGVTISRLSNHIDTYDGEIWWLPLSDESRLNLNYSKFFDFLLRQNSKKYDILQAIKSALDTLDQIPFIGETTLNCEDFSKFFCSELVAAGLEAGGVIGSINASEVTPIDLCKFDIYAPQYYQIKGREEKAISGYNSLNPERWAI